MLRFLSVLFLSLLISSPAAAEQLRVVHGLSAFGDLKYPADFEHFDYVNPEAPKGGKMSIQSNSAQASFDSLNPYILKGDPAEDIDTLVVEHLMVRAVDEPDAMYGLIAESAEIPADRRFVIFNLRPDARFHDGTPVTAEDVLFSFEILKEKGHPAYRLRMKDVVKAEVRGPHRIYFEFAPDAMKRDLPLIVADLPVFSKAWYAERDFDSATLEAPMASGPYRVKDAANGLSMTLERDPTYWGADLPVNRGRFNFDEIRIDYFADRAVSMEAFKAGAYDMREEFTAKTWATQYTGPAMEAGMIKQDMLPDGRPSGVQAFFINSRKAKFADPRVREALDLAFDYEWTNRVLFHDAYSRMASVFENSDLKATGEPSAAELALLEPHRDKLDPDVFGPAYVPPKTDGSGRNRKNLRKAAALLNDAGWRVVDGKRRNAAGEVLTIEFLDFQTIFARIAQPYIQSLEKLGIDATYRMVESAQYQRRLEDFDYDITTRRFVQPNTPSVEQRTYWSSLAADLPGSFNISGIKDPVVDALIEDIVAATDRDSLTAATRALDRVILHGHYFVPQWYKGLHTIAWWDKFGRPGSKPVFARGIIDLWWYDNEKAGRISAWKQGRD